MAPLGLASISADAAAPVAWALDHRCRPRHGPRRSVHAVTQQVPGVTTQGLNYTVESNLYPSYPQGARDARLIIEQERNPGAETSAAPAAGTARASVGGRPRGPQRGAISDVPAGACAGKPGPPGARQAVRLHVAFGRLPAA